MASGQPGAGAVGAQATGPEAATVHPGVVASSKGGGGGGRGPAGGDIREGQVEVGFREGRQVLTASEFERSEMGRWLAVHYHREPEIASR